MMNYSERLAELQLKINNKELYSTNLSCSRKQQNEIIQLQCDLLSRQRILTCKINRMNKGGLFALFYKITGSYSDKMDELRGDLREVETGLTSCRAKMDAFLEDIRFNEYQLDLIKDAEKEYEMVFGEKREAILNSATIEAEKLRDLEEKIKELEEQEGMFDGALVAARKVNRTIRDLISDLDSAESMGVFSAMNGNKSFDLLECSYLYDAKGHAKQLENDLKLFREELAEFGHFESFVEDIEDASSFQILDFCFDNIAFDFISLSNISNIKSKVKKLRSEIESAINKMRAMKEKVSTEISAAKVDVKEFILRVDL